MNSLAIMTKEKAHTATDGMDFEQQNSIGQQTSKHNVNQAADNGKHKTNIQGNRTTKPLKSKNRLNCEQKGEPSCSPIRLTI